MIKKLARFFLLLFLSLFTLYLIFISAISVVIGVTNTERAGYWMPILCGLLILCVSTFLIRLIMYILRQARYREKYPYI
jgi:hypothetical protein